MGYADTETVVKKARTTKNFFVRNFILNYEKLIDKNSLKNDRENYIKTLEYIDNILKDIDFNTNILFVCEKNISNEVFLTGFSRLERLTTYYLCNIIQLHDIMFGNKTSDNPNLSDDDIMYSYQDIKETVLCLYIDKYMYPMQDDITAASLIVSRENRKLELNKNLLNWVFFRGNMNSLKNSDKLAKRLYQLYNSNRDNGWLIVDLNSLVKHSTSNNTSKSIDLRNDGLEDIY